MLAGATARRLRSNIPQGNDRGKVAVLALIPWSLCPVMAVLHRYSETEAGWLQPTPSLCRMKKDAEEKKLPPIYRSVMPSGTMPEDPGR